MEKLTVIIPARGGSKRLPSKNLRKLFGESLVRRMIRICDSAYSVKAIYVSTEDERIKKEIGNRCEVIDRPKKFAVDCASSASVMVHALTELKNRGKINDESPIACIQVTSPLILPEDINGAWKLFKKNPSIVRSVNKSSTVPEWMFTKHGNLLSSLLPMVDFTKRSQDLPEYYELNGAIRIQQVKTMLYNSNHLPIYGYVTPVERSVDIDLIDDMEEAKRIFLEAKKKGKK